MATFVEDIRNFLLLKSHYLYRLENKTIKEMIKPYEEAKKTIVDRINRLSEELEQQAEIRYSNYTVLKLNYMLAEINEVLRIAAIDSERVLQQIREEVARVEYEQLSKILQDKYSKINIDVLGVPYRQIDYILQNPMLGESIGDKLLWANSSALRYMQREIYQSIILGETIQQATKRLLGTGKKLSGLSGNLLLNRARTIARTEILYVSNEVNRAIYRQNMDVIKGVQFVSTLDSRTCIYCGKLSGEIFLYENGIDKSPIVPRHPNCRCVYVPLTYSWEELEKMTGVKITSKSKKDYFSGAEDREMPNYSQWLKQQPTEVQKEILGKKRYKAWKDNNYELTEMATQTQDYDISAFEAKVSEIKTFEITD